MNGFRFRPINEVCIIVARHGFRPARQPTPNPTKVTGRHADGGRHICDLKESAIASSDSFGRRPRLFLKALNEPACLAQRKFSERFIFTVVYFAIGRSIRIPLSIHEIVGFRLTEHRRENRRSCLRAQRHQRFPGDENPRMIVTVSHDISPQRRSRPAATGRSTTVVDGDIGWLIMIQYESWARLQFYAAHTLHRP